MLQAAQPGDSAEVRDADARYNRALERGIGEIALRPENCHHEIREPVRSMSEVRILVAPDDRLQTMTYVEEVGGFVNMDGSPYISDYPDIPIDLVGYHDPNSVPNAAGIINRDVNHPEETPLRIRASSADGTNIVVFQQLGNALGQLQDGSDWNGIVNFKWDADAMLYRSDGFDVTLNVITEVANNGLNVPTQFDGTGAMLPRACDNFGSASRQFRPPRPRAILLPSGARNQQHAGLRGATAYNGKQFLDPPSRLRS